MSYVRFKVSISIFLSLDGKISNKKRKAVIAEVGEGKPDRDREKS